MTEKMELNCLGMKCPRPIIEIAKAARRSPPGSILHVFADDLAFESDVKAWAEQANATILAFEKEGAGMRVELKLKEE
jgi:TusA-related sulfurtransferase